MSVTLHTGDCLDVLRGMEAQSVNCCVTSPPYFGLRDYGHDGQIGFEGSPDAYIERLVQVFREVRRVLRDDGTLWLNLGDSYGKDKNRIMIPARVALALQQDGWYLRDEIVWHKPNPMPASVRDRTTPAHEMVYMLSKRERYFYDQEAIKEPPSGNDGRPQRRRAMELARQHGLSDKHLAAIRSCGVSDTGKAQITQNGCGKNATLTQALADEAKAALGGYYREFLTAPTRNRRSVWTVTTKPYKGAHFATFPADLIEPCVLAGAPAGGVVLDPFLGSGTTAATALRLNRAAVGIELNPEYMALAEARIAETQQAMRRAAEEATRQPDLFVEPSAPAPQQEGFDL